MWQTDSFLPPNETGLEGKQKSGGKNGEDNKVLILEGASDHNSLHVFLFLFL